MDQQETAQNEGTPSVEDQVTELVSKATKNDKGTLVLADQDLEGVDPALALAARTELRYRNTQAAYTKTQQEKSKLQKVTENLTERLTSTVAVSFTEEQQATLAALKDKPDEYYAKRREFEKQAQQDLQTELTRIEEESGNMTELEVREAKLAAFNETATVKLTDEIIQNELPVKYIKALEEGKVTFDEFLVQAHSYLTKGKVIQGANDKIEMPVDMNRLPGGSTPSKQAIEGDIIESYHREVY